VPQDGFRVSVEQPSPGRVVVGVAGEIDVATAPEVERALAEAGAEKRVVLDLSECQFIDSSGLRTLLGARSAAVSAGGSLVLVVADPGLLRVFEVVGLGDILEIHGSLARALS
jgi:anti-sigma B factor antagonist